MTSQLEVKKCCARDGAELSLPMLAKKVGAASARRLFEQSRT
jgi:hypothetical protein